jgi:hypothetical protein
MILFCQDITILEEDDEHKNEVSASEFGINIGQNREERALTHGPRLGWSLPVPEPAGPKLPSSGGLFG